MSDPRRGKHRRKVRRRKPRHYRPSRPNDPRTELHVFVRHELAERGESARDMAKRLKLNPTRVSETLQGKVRRTDILEQIEEYLGYDLRELARDARIEYLRRELQMAEAGIAGEEA